jgi:RNA polymerase sigma-70 factor (ECF subfamily)
MTSLRASPSAPTDAEAIARSRSDPAAFELVFERHLAAVHAYAQRRVGRDLAEEVTAETFTRGFEARKRYDTSHAGALPWLLGIAGNVMRRHWRTERRRLEAYARAAGPERPVDAPDDAGEIIAAVAELPRRYREVVLLWAWADLSYDEIAHALDLPVGTVRSRLSRARGRLRAREGAPREPRTSYDDPKELSRV